jgi:cell division protein FtsL
VYVGLLEENQKVEREKQQWCLSKLTTRWEMKVGAKFVSVKTVLIFTLSHVIFLCLEDFNVSNEDSYRISKEIEDLRSQLALKKKELKCYQENKKLRVELALKVKVVECIRKENEQLKAQNKDLQENVCFQLSSCTCWYHKCICTCTETNDYFFAGDLFISQYLSYKLKQQICSLSLF